MTDEKKDLYIRLSNRRLDMLADTRIEIVEEFIEAGDYLAAKKLLAQMEWECYLDTPRGLGYDY